MKFSGALNVGYRLADAVRVGFLTRRGNGTAGRVLRCGVVGWEGAGIARVLVGAVDS